MSLLITLPDPMFHIFGNWKSYKTLPEARTWFDSFRNTLSTESVQLMKDGVLSVVVFPPAPLLYPLHTLGLDLYGFSVGSQDISPHDEGRETGLINASSLRGIATHVIVGHVEQRKRGDSQEIVSMKYQRAVGQKLRPILCVTQKEQLIDGAELVSYEPPNSISLGIGKGNAAPVNDVSSFKTQLDRHDVAYIYGGSIDGSNCIQYLKPRIVDGFLVGAISLDPLRFSEVVNACTPYVAQT